MLKKKLGAFPDFKEITCLRVGSLLLMKTKQNQVLTLWQGIIDRLLEDKRKKNFTDFLEFCNGLF